MSEPEPYLSQIMLFPFNWAPKGYALCDGETIQISENQALYALLGTNFGGDGTNTFCLPDLRGRTAVGAGNASFYPYPLYPGTRMGTERVELTLAELPHHTHALQASTDDADIHIPSNAFLANIKPVSGAEFPLYSPRPSANSITGLSNETCGYAGGTFSHDNMQPSIVINYCIAITGVFPPRN